MISPFHIQPNNFTPKQYGENGEIEYGWSYNMKEWILQFFFQLTRTNENVLDNLELNLREIMYYMVNTVRLQPILLMHDYKYYFILLYKLIGHTRDIIDGKGERSLTYMMIYVWYDFFPELAFYALSSLNEVTNNIPPYGSWKDIKYFCNYYKNKTGKEEHALIKECIQIINKQLYIDFYSENKDISISLLAKWIPREKSKKFGWLFPYLAYDFFNHYLQTAKSLHSIINAKNKCKTNYRKIISCLNEKIDTLERKLCGQKWSTIQFEKVSSIALNKYRKSFLNEKKDQKDLTEDRKKSEENFENFIINTKNNISKINVKQIGMNVFTKSAFSILNEVKKNSIYNEKLELEKDLLNIQWKEHSFQTNSTSFGTVIPIIDLSSSMVGEPMNAAIALGIRVAEKSTLGKRLIILSNSPNWINLENKSTFIECVEEIRKYEMEIEMNCNLNAVFDLILETIIDVKMSLENIYHLSIVFFSAMQVDTLSTSYRSSSIYEKITEKYKNTGLLLYKIPLKVPTILFWNLSSSNSFPYLSLQPNISMVSGFNSSLLNILSKHGINVLGEKTPWDLLEELLANKRYSILENKAKEVLDKYLF